MTTVTDPIRKICFGIEGIGDDRSINSVIINDDEKLLPNQTFKLDQSDAIADAVVAGNATVAVASMTEPIATTEPASIEPASTEPVASTEPAATMDEPFPPPAPDATEPVATMDEPFPPPAPAQTADEEGFTTVVSNRTRRANRQKKANQPTIGGNHTKKHKVRRNRMKSRQSKSNKTRSKRTVNKSKPSRKYRK